MVQKLILSDRLASIGELVSGVAHELNNPLTSIIGFSQLIIDGKAETNLKEDLNIVYREAQRAAGIVKNLLPLQKACSVQQRGR
jgi:two-component system NtrC family sensor kinase